MPLPNEPDELALWRWIAEHRDGLVRRAEGARTVGVRAEVLVRYGGGELGEAIQFLTEDAAEACRELQELDALINARPSKASAPRKLVEQLKEQDWRCAIEAVVRFIRAEQEADIVAAAGAACLELADLTGDAVTTEEGARAVLLKLETWIEEARAERGERSGRVEELARTVVAKAAGISRDSRRLR